MLIHKSVNHSLPERFFIAWFNRNKLRGSSFYGGEILNFTKAFFEKLEPAFPSGKLIQVVCFDACSVKLAFRKRSETKSTVELIPKSEASREGRRRSADDWSYTLDVNDQALFAGRGFTGHSLSREERNGKHLPEFGLINMNGRLYDPLLGRFLSPDNNVQLPDFSQNFNRYSYCLNNPLIYTDPTGEFWHLVIGAAIGGVMNWAMNGAEFSWEGLGYFGIGAAAGALGAGVGVGIQTASAGASFWAGFVGSSQGISTILSVGYTSGFVNGALAGAGAGFASGFLTGTGNGLMQGQSFGDALGSGLKTGAISGASGALLGGFAGGIDTYRDGRSFWDGGPTLETKLEILLKNNNAELISEIGEAGVGDVTLGTNRNLQGTGYRNAGGSMMNPDGDLVNGFHRQGRTFDISVDGYAWLNNNKIYLSKSTVCQMWRGSATAKETLFHEWYHAKDYYTGYASFLHSKNSSNYTYMLEFRAHSFNYSRLATPNRLMLMEHYARLYWGLPGLF